ncbi:MAG: hypothetical protein AB2604_10660 [Candidatus Thiodiazotropha taylori]
MALRFESSSSITVETNAIDITDLVFSDNTQECVIAYEIGIIDVNDVFTANQSLTLRLAGQDLVDAMVTINTVIAAQAQPNFYAAVQMTAFAAIQDLHNLPGGVLI